MSKRKPQAKSSFLQKYEFVIPLALFAVFLAITLPGISWGAPDIWHPDEIVYVSINALYEHTEFDVSNFNHPHLPIYMMLGLGKILVALGGSAREVLIGARVLSAVLTGLMVVLTYFITRRMGHNIYVAALSGVLLLSVSEMPHNGHFAHNDTFAAFFSTLTLFLLVQYQTREHRGWLYAAFVAAGLAVSSKYSAASMVLLPVVLYLWTQRAELRRPSLRIVETLFIGGALSFLGYAAGTPRALLWMAYYFKRLIPASDYWANYGREPDSIIGAIGQYSIFAEGVGLALFLLFTAAFVWSGYQVIRALRKGSRLEDARALLLLAIIVLDLPFLAAYNYSVRFFLPLMPPFAILSAIFVKDLWELASRSKNTRYPNLLKAGLALVIVLSFARSISVMLLFLNDARIPASTFIASLPTNASLEHTEYPPSIPGGHFEREHNYPLFFRKSPDQQLPISKKYVFNAGEAGLDDRLTDYLVVDTFTTQKFDDPYVCQAMQVECDFFKQLAAGRSDHYRLIQNFSYSLPVFLPHIQIAFVNPEIRVYERIQ
ncbi:MAG TPA: phospholipid carrier-dependent glycosyltransferase [Anaerolineales bacterium]